MKKLVVVLMIFPLVLVAGTPELDGYFDGTGVWGNPVAVADGNAGFSVFNAKKIYVTDDASYIYLGADVHASWWACWAFLLNTKTGGSSTDSWSLSVTYDHINKPDYVVRGYFNDHYAEINIWNGSAWNGVDTDIGNTEYADEIRDNDIDGFVEIRVPKTTITESVADIQFYITGDNPAYGTFDACPDDEVVTEWDQTGNPTSLDNYVTDVSLPVELTGFKVEFRSGGVLVSWTTESEIENLGFLVSRKLKLESSNWEEIASYVYDASLEGHGSTTEKHEYQFTDTAVLSGVTYQYRLGDVDYNGKVTWHKSVEIKVNAEDVKIPVEFGLQRAYPNPFNPTTTISYQLPSASFVKVSIYDVRGKLVETLVNEQKDRGSHLVVWDAGGLSSGIYIYKIEAGEYSEVNKCLLVR